VLEMEVIFSDNHILVVNKPAGIPTQGEKSLEEVAKTWVKKQFAKTGNVFLHPVHRLDTNVSGLVLFARTSKALSRLQEQMRKRAIEKIYYAYVEGDISPSEATVEHYLIHDTRRARVVSSSHPEGKQALLHYRCIEYREGVSLLEVTLYTGRYHQIRVQLATIGFPILGDMKYGSSVKGERILLHHGKLSFEHPVSKKMILLHKKLDAC